MIKVYKKLKLYELHIFFIYEKSEQSLRQLGDIEKNRVVPVRLEDCNSHIIVLDVLQDTILPFLLHLLRFFFLIFFNSRAVH